MQSFGPEHCELLGDRKVFYAVVDQHLNWRVSDRHDKKYIQWHALLPGQLPLCEALVKHETKDNYELVVKEKRLSVFMTASHAYVILRLNEARPEFVRKPTIRYDFERKIIKRLPVLQITAGIALGALSMVAGYQWAQLNALKKKIKDAKPADLDEITKKLAIANQALEQEKANFKQATDLLLTTTENQVVSENEIAALQLHIEEAKTELTKKETELESAKQDLAKIQATKPSRPEIGKKEKEGLEGYTLVEGKWIIGERAQQEEKEGEGGGGEKAQGQGEEAKEEEERKKQEKIAKEEEQGRRGEQKEGAQAAEGEEGREEGGGKGEEGREEGGEGGGGGGEGGGEPVVVAQAGGEQGGKAQAGKEGEEGEEKRQRKAAGGKAQAGEEGEEKKGGGGAAPIVQPVGEEGEEKKRQEAKEEEERKRQEAKEEERKRQKEEKEAKEEEERKAQKAKEEEEKKVEGGGEQGQGGGKADTPPKEEEAEGEGDEGEGDEGEEEEEEEEEEAEEEGEKKADTPPKEEKGEEGEEKEAVVQQVVEGEKKAEEEEEEGEAEEEEEAEEEGEKKADTPPKEEKGEEGEEKEAVVQQVVEGEKKAEEEEEEEEGEEKEEKEEEEKQEAKAEKEKQTECIKLITDYPFDDFYNKEEAKDLRDRIESCEKDWNANCTEFCDASDRMKAVSFNADKVIDRVKQGGNEIVVLFGDAKFSFDLRNCETTNTVFEEYMTGFNTQNKKLASQITVKQNDAQFQYVDKMKHQKELRPGKATFSGKDWRLSNGYKLYKVKCGEKTGHLTVVSMAGPITPKEVTDEFFETPYKDMLKTEEPVKKSGAPSGAVGIWKRSYIIHESLNLMKESVRECQIKKQEDWDGELTGRLTEDGNCPLTKQIFDALKNLGENPKFTFLFEEGQFGNVKAWLRKKC
jgi:hypothetical protein